MSHSTPANLPDDLLAFLGAGRQLEYDADGTSIGRITLKRDTDLTLSTIQTFPGCQSIIDDPYSSLPGLYHSDVYDLVAESEDYSTEGLLCWIVALQCFGCIDPEHGDVITYPKATWTDIVADPLPYLEAQWLGDADVAVRALPWLHFPLHLSDSDEVIEPYGARCVIHDAAIIGRKTSKPPLFELLQEHNLDDWFQHSRTKFPFAGVPLSESKLLCCEHCRAAEDAWLQNINESMPVLNAKRFANGWAQCPGCEVRFSTTDPGAFSDGVCLTCGQRINLVD